MDNELSPVETLREIRANFAALQAELDAARARIAELEAEADAADACAIAQDGRIAELEAARRWVSVGERLPNRVKHVLVYTDTFSQHTAWLDWVNRDNNPLFVYYEAPGKIVYLNNVTHWQSLPAAPEAPDAR